MYKGIDLHQVSKLKGLDFLAREIVTGFLTGLHKSPLHGFSVEFAEHRSYNSGDSIKHIDWKLYGRTDKLYLKRYEEETNLRCFFAIDGSSSMYFPYDESRINKAAFAIYATASLIELMKRQRDAFGLITYNHEIDVLTESKLSETHLKRIYADLEKLLKPSDKGKSTNNISVLSQMAELLPKRSVVIVFTDLTDAYQDTKLFIETLQQLRFSGREVIVFQLYEQDQEYELNYSNRLHIFEDGETGERIRINPTQLKEQYKKVLKEKFQEINREILNMGADIVQVNINEDIEKVLLAYLIKRQKILKK